MISALILAALSVVPVYTNRNHAAGNVQLMTNMQAWASAVEDAIGQRVGTETNEVNDLIHRYDETNLTARIDAKVGQSEVNAAVASAAASATNYTDTSCASTLDEAKGYADSHFLNMQDGGSVEFTYGRAIINQSYNGILLMTDDWEIYPSLMFGEDYESPRFSITPNDYIGFEFNKENVISSLKPDGSKVATSNMLESVAYDISTKTVSPVSNRVDYLDGYMAGQRVRVSVTNYYGNTSGELPRLRFEEYVTETNTIGGVEVETNYWKTVWDEQSKYDRFLTLATSAIAAMTQDLYRVYYNLLQERLATKAPRAWGTLTSAGEAAPQGKVWLTEPNTVFAGGTEYAHAMVGTGVIGVLTSKGAAVYTDGEVGRFHFTTDDRQYHFGMNIASRYEIGCATDGITVTPVAGNQMVDLTYNITMSGKPILYYTPSLTPPVSWEQITDSSGSPISGATVYASWDQSPPAGSEICTINCGASLSGFFKASVEYAGTSKFETNMMADLAGGIIATNQTTNQMQPVEPYISSGSVLWRVKQ